MARGRDAAGFADAQGIPAHADWPGLEGLAYATVAAFDPWQRPALGRVASLCERYRVCRGKGISEWTSRHQPSNQESLFAGRFEFLRHSSCWRVSLLWPVPASLSGHANNLRSNGSCSPACLACSASPDSAGMQQSTGDRLLGTIGLLRRRASSPVTRSSGCLCFFIHLAVECGWWRHQASAYDPKRTFRTECTC